ncbi:MAG: DUF3127 domain-containing protein [Prevotella sp.]|nr:DUF3127 domain-containing protein [Prevotella sp.]
MDLQGKIIVALPERKGVSARGEWVLQEFVVETHDTYPRKMMFSVFGQDRLQRFNIKVGQEVNVSFDVDAREYNGRWFNSIRAYDVRLVDPASIAGTGAAPYVAPTQNTAPAAPAPGAAPFPPAPEEDNIDDLPF